MVMEVLNPAINSIVYLSILRTFICVEAFPISLKGELQDISTGLGLVEEGI